MPVHTGEIVKYLRKILELIGLWNVVGLTGSGMSQYIIVGSATVTSIILYAIPKITEPKG